MAVWKIHRARTDRDLCDMLNGAIDSPIDIQNGLYLDGLTLVIDAGGGAGDKTVTFAPALSRNWTPEEIVAQISAADVSLATVAKLSRATPAQRGGSPTNLRLVNGGNTVKVDKTGTANTLFGWSVAADTTGEPYIDDDIMSRIGMTDQSWWAISYK